MWKHKKWKEINAAKRIIKTGGPRWKQFTVFFFMSFAPRCVVEKQQDKTDEEKVVQHRLVASRLKTSTPSYIRQKARQPVVVEGEVQVAIRVRPDPGRSTGEHDDEGEPSNSIPRENVVSGVNANYPEKP